MHVHDEPFGVYPPWYYGVIVQADVRLHSALVNGQTVAGGSTLVVGPEDSFAPVTLFFEEFRTANTDLLIQTNAVCAMLLVDFSDFEFEDDRIDLTLLFGAVRVWVELDGIPVLVDANDADGNIGYFLFIF